MVKTKLRSTPKKRASRAKTIRSKNPKLVQLTPEQRARLIAFQKFVKEKEDDWNAMTPEEQKEEDAAWKRIMNRMNDDRKGYRQVFVES